MFTACSDVLGDDWHWGWWNNDTCFMTFEKGYAYNVMISMGYMSVEFLVLQFALEKPTTLNT